MQVVHRVAGRQGHGGYVYLVEAEGLAALGAAEVDMVVVMLVLGAGFLAQGKLHSAADVVDAVQQPLLLKRVERTVNRNPVVAVAEHLLDIGMGQRLLVRQEQVQNVEAAFGLAKAVFSQKFFCLFHSG